MFDSILLSPFSNRNFLISDVGYSRKFRVIFPIIYSGIDKHQANLPQCEKPPIINSYASDLINPSVRRKTRKFIDRPFEAIFSNLCLQSYRSRNWILDT